jgi:mannosyl-oligosaccharide glucosidase
MRHLGISFLLTSLLSATGVVASEDPSDVNVLIRESGRASNQSLLWGPYKSNLYFGVRPRIPKSLSAGLIWGKVDEYVGAQQSMLPSPGPCLPALRDIGS